MAALIAPDCVRYTVHGTFEGHEIANIVDMRINEAFAPALRAAALNIVGKRILLGFAHTLLEIVADVYTMTSVSWIDLDSEDGSTGEVTDSEADNGPQYPTTLLPDQGGTGSAAAPGNVAIRLNKGTIATRGQRQGRMYLVGLPEGITDPATPNNVAAASITSMNTKCEEFRAYLDQDGSSLEVSSEMVVIHTKGGVFDSVSPVTSLTVDSFTASQTRRIRRR